MTKRWQSVLHVQTLFWRPLRPASSSVAWFSDVRGRSRSFSLSSLREAKGTANELGRLRIRLPPQALRFWRRRGERETQVTGYEPQGTMGRVQTAGEARLARCLPPAFLCAHIFIERETSGSLRLLIAVVIFGSPSQENRPRGRLLAMFYSANVAQFVPRVFRPRFSE